jgi:RND family efflux transporter MFP subunit
MMPFEHQIDPSSPNPTLDERRTKIGPWTIGRRGLMILSPAAVVAGGVALFSVMMATGPKPEKKTEPPKPAAAQVSAVQARSMRISVSVQGEVRPRVEADLAAQAAGRIVWTNPSFADGGAFAAGEVLVRIEPADYQLAVTRAQAQVAQAKEGLAREEAEAELARQDWSTLGRGDPSALVLREPQLAQARAALAAAEAQRRGAELDLERTSVRAPFAGRVRQQKANVGDYVAPGAQLGAVFATDAMEVRVPLTDSDLAHLGVGIGFVSEPKRPGPAADVSAVVAGAPRTWKGRLVRTEATVDARTRIVYGIVQVADPFSAQNPTPLAPGLFVTVRFEGAREETLVAAPRGALKKNEFIFVVGADDAIQVRSVRAVQTSADEVYFRDGVKPGERVVVSALPSAREGMKITPVLRAPSPRP